MLPSAARVVFLSGAHHPREPHQYRATNMLLARALNQSKLPIQAHVVANDGYPRDESILHGAAAVVVFSTGHKGHPVIPKLKEFDALMAAGTGLVLLHWSTEPNAPLKATQGATRHESEDRFLEWMGGYCDPTFSVNPHWTPSFKPVPHPIWNGVKPFSIRDEWYFHMRFGENLKNVTPILSDLPPPSTLRRKDGPREGNPDVRRAVANGEVQHVAWAYQRPSGGRGFGWTGGHYFSNWQHDDYRKAMLNAIVWVAGVGIPPDGVQSALPKEAAISTSKANGAASAGSATLASLSKDRPFSVLIVGASRGIGLELARVYAESGATVSATTRSVTPELSAIVKGHLYLVDVRNSSQVDALGRDLDDSAASLDMVIHSAGVKVGTEEDVMDINAEAPFRIAKAVLPALLRSQRKIFVVISSDRGMSRFQSEVNRGRCSGDPKCLYTRSKMLTNRRFRDYEPSWKQQGITAIAVHPGWTKTDMSPTAKQTARFSATSIRTLCERLRAEDSGKFFNYNGKTLAW